MTCPPPDAEALVVFKRSMEAANLPTAKNLTFVLSWPKIIGGHENGGGWNKTRWLCPPPRA